MYMSGVFLQQFMYVAPKPPLTEPKMVALRADEPVRQQYPILFVAQK